MEICSKRLLVLVVLLGLVTVAAVYGKNVEEVSNDAKSKAGEAQGTVESWTDWAKETFRVVTDSVSKESDANLKYAKGAANKASDTASVYWQGLVSSYNSARDGVNKFTQGLTNSGKANVNDASSRVQEGYEYVKKNSNEAASKAYETAKATMDKAYETAGVASGKTKESADATGGKAQGVFESSKQKLAEQYEAAKEAVNEQVNVASKLASDVGERVKHMAGAGHEEL